MEPAAAASNDPTANQGRVDSRSQISGQVSADAVAHSWMPPTPEPLGAAPIKLLATKPPAFVELLFMWLLSSWSSSSSRRRIYLTGRPVNPIRPIIVVDGGGVALSFA